LERLLAKMVSNKKRNEGRHGNPEIFFRPRIDCNQEKLEADLKETKK
jgi:hypothetical protein